MDLDEDFAAERDFECVEEADDEETEEFDFLLFDFLFFLFYYYLSLSLPRSAFLFADWVEAEEDDKVEELFDLETFLLVFLLFLSAF